MKEKELREVLEELQLELLQYDPSDVALRGKRDALIKNIQDALGQAKLSGGPSSLGERLSDELANFVDEHPKIAQLMNAASNLLSAIGI